MTTSSRSCKREGGCCLQILESGLGQATATTHNCLRRNFPRPALLPSAVQSCAAYRVRGTRAPIAPVELHEQWPRHWRDIVSCNFKQVAADRRRCAIERHPQRRRPESTIACGAGCRLRPCCTLYLLILIPPAVRSPAAAPAPGRAACRGITRGGFNLI